MTMTVRIFDVGGFVRDELLGIRSKDRDCTVVIEGATAGMTVDQGLDVLRRFLKDNGFKIFVDTPEHATIRAHQPVKGSVPADFVLARREGPYSDGRRPDFVEVGTLADDLARRDFTVNALARDLDTGEIIDHHGGLNDLCAMTLRFVGDPMERIREDGLRVMRAIRFQVTKGFVLDKAARAALHDREVPALLARVSEERREQELHRMFSSGKSMRFVLNVLHDLPAELIDAMFTGRVRLTSTLKKAGR